MRILLVEDEAPLRETLAARLKREGYAVDMAADGDEGLYLGREVPFDVAIIGGNLAGSMAAIMLARRGIKTVVLDPATLRDEVNRAVAERARVTQPK